MGRLIAAVMTTLAMFGSALVWAESVVVVRSGDTLSELAHQHIGGRVWGRAGALERLLAENPGRTDRICPGDRIRLPSTAQPVEAMSVPDPSEPASARIPSESQESERASEEPETRLSLLVDAAAYTSALRGSQLSNSTVGIFATEISQRFGLSLEQEWAERTFTRLGLSLMLERWKAPLGGSSIVGMRQDRSRFYAEAELPLISRLSLSANLGSEQRVVYRGRPLTEPAGQIFETLSAPDLTLALHAAILKSKNAAWSLRVHYGWIGPMDGNTYSFKLGQGYGAAAGFSHSLGAATLLRGQWKLSVAQQPGDVLELKRTDQELSLQFGFEL